MIEITIKTLDSRNHVFSVENEFTVKQLKEHIAEPVNVSVESQRLIYCGRVLVDDKKLSDYDVNGKVIHLVQRAPPPSVLENSGDSAEPRTTTNPRRPGWMFNPGVRVDGTGGNAMYLGAMAFPADLMDAQGITMPNPRHGLSQSRLAVVRSMLRRARGTLHNLENLVLNESVNEIYVGSSDVPFEPDTIPDADGAGLRAPASPTFPSRVVNADGTESAQIGTASASVEESSPLEEAVPAETETESPEAPPSAPTSSEEQTSSTTAGENSGANGRSRFTGTAALADIIGQIRGVNRRFQPFLDRYHNLMRTDPFLSQPEEAQRLFNQVSEIMHFLAHAYHAISDVMCDFSEPPPRLLLCRPVLIQHSAVLQTGIPIQVNLGRGNNSRSTATATTADGEQRSSDNPPRESTATTTSENANSNQRDRRSGRDESSRRSQSTTSDQTPQARIHQTGNFEFYVDVGPGTITIDPVDGTVVSDGSPPNSGERVSTSFSLRSNPSDLANFVQDLDQVRQVLNQALQVNRSSGPPTGSSTSASASQGATASASSGPQPSVRPIAVSGPVSSDTVELFLQSIEPFRQGFGNIVYYNTHNSNSSTSAGSSNASRSSVNATEEATNPSSSPLPPGAVPTDTSNVGSAHTQPTTSTQTRSTTRPHVHITGSGIAFPLGEAAGVRLDLDQVLHAMGGGNIEGTAQPSNQSSSGEPSSSNGTNSGEQSLFNVLSRMEGLDCVRQVLDVIQSAGQGPSGRATTSTANSDPAATSSSTPSTTEPPSSTTLPSSSTTTSTRTQTEFPPMGSAHTQPTTSTQTRSTTRPHVHISPGFQGMGVPGFFDPFLPCNSHHIRNSRSSRRRNVGASDLLESAISEIRVNRRAPVNNPTEQNGTSSVTQGNEERREVLINRLARLLDEERESQRGSGIRVTPADVTLVLSSPGHTREFSSETTFMEVLMSNAGAVHPNGEDSLASELFIIISTHLRVQDLFEMNFRNILTTLRPYLCRFVRERLMQATDGLLSFRDGIARFIEAFRPFFSGFVSSLNDIPMREDVDLSATINQLNQVAIPRMIQTMHGDSSYSFNRNLQNQWCEYCTALFSILSFCCVNGSADGYRAFIRFGVRFAREIPGLDAWADSLTRRIIREYRPHLECSIEKVRRFLVFRLRETPTVSTSSSVPASTDGSVELPLPVAPQPPHSLPMEVEDTVGVAEAVPTAEQISEPLPDVILGAEQWHSHVPPDWVPIITRDRERQRRQAVQGPLSEAYLSGMPSKRRKVVSSSKPQGSLARVITESMSSAIAAAGVPSIDGVAESAGSDASIRNAYKEQLRSTAGSTIRTHPDFCSEKYPNSAKFFSPK